MAPPQLPTVPPPPHITGRLVGGAVLLAAVREDPLRQRERYREFLHIGWEVAQGQNLWAETDCNVWAIEEQRDLDCNHLSPLKELANGVVAPCCAVDPVNPHAGATFRSPVEAKTLVTAG